MMIKSCRIDYWLCGQESEFFETSQMNTTSNIVSIPLGILKGSSRTYCYTVTASNGTHTIKVKGEIGKLYLYVSQCSVYIFNFEI